MAQPPSRVPPRELLLDERSYEARLRLTDDLAAVPAELTTDLTLEDRQRAALAWRALQATPEQAIADRAELDKLDRAIVTARKQVFAARSQASTLQADLERARTQRFANPVVYSLGALALAGAGAWLLQRRRMAAGEYDGPPTSQAPMSQSPSSHIPSSPAAFPPAVDLPDESEFDGSDLGVVGDEADQWIERARVAVPSPGQLPGGKMPPAVQ